MMNSQPTISLDATIDNAITQYHANLTEAAAIHQEESARPPDSGFRPCSEVPALTEPLRIFFRPSLLRMMNLPSYRGHAVRMLDLTGNPGTRTTKTFASLLIVARAVEHIQRTGERVMIVTATSGNKGTALRDAVLRAVDEGLVSPADLGVSVLAPRGSLPKLWSSRLSTDPELRRRNPVMLYQGSQPEEVKQLARQFVHDRAGQYARESGLRLWYTLDLANYVVADTVRAYFEADAFPIQDGERRVHAHAVSSAFGLLGYHLGRRVLARLTGRQQGTHPQFLLVQHLRTPDMVLHLLHSSFSRANMPAFSRTSDGRYVQHDDPSFPQVTDDPAEDLDSTFYSRHPATSPTMSSIVARHGGGGIVVSGQECRARYPHIRELLQPFGMRLPGDPEMLREWSLVMAMTGIMNAIDRGLVPDRSAIVVHASGSYSAGDFTPLPQGSTVPVQSLDDMSRSVSAAAHR
jgi:hypothetical protein